MPTQGPGRTIQRTLTIALSAAALVLAVAGPASACSPPFETPTIRALGPAQVVLVGTTGERVPGGRLFNVERVYNGPVATTPIIIAFKEGEPVGDCSYPVTTGARLIIAPFGQPGGPLSADLGTLQDDPASADGQRYVAEAIELFGPGVVPVAAPTSTETPDASEPTGSPDLRPPLLGLAFIVGALFGSVVLIARRPGQR